MNRNLLSKFGTTRSNLAYYAVAILFIVVMMFPLYWSLYNSFMPTSDLLNWPPTIVASELTLENYRNLFLRYPVEIWILNSVIVCALATTLVILITVPAAYGISRFDFVGSSYISRFSILVYMFPYILLGIPFFIVFRNLGMLDNVIGLAIAHSVRGLPFALLILLVFFDDIPQQYEEAAFLTGAERITILRKIVVPLALPGIAAVAIFIIIFSWIEYFFALIVMQSSSSFTLPLGIAGLFDMHQVDWGLVLAGIMIVSVPPMLGIFWLQKYLLKGFALERI